MHRLDTSTAVAVKPAPEAAGTPGYFTKGDPVGGLPASVPGQDWFNMVQEELVAILDAFGVTPDQTKADFSQIATALTTNLASLNSFTKLFSSSGYQKLPVGLIVQWGQTSTSSSGDVAITFPITFPNGVMETYCSSNTNAASFSNLFSPTLSGASIAGWLYTGARTTINARWLAIGH